jgi:hypothetical protein
MLTSSTRSLSGIAAALAALLLTPRSACAEDGWFAFAPADDTGPA